MPFFVYFCRYTPCRDLSNKAINGVSVVRIRVGVYAAVSWIVYTIGSLCVCVQELNVASLQLCLEN